MKRFLTYCCLFVLPIIIVGGIIQQTPLNKSFAYSEFVKGDCSGHGKWLHDRLYLNNTPIDIAFLGSSATWNAIDDSALTARLTALKGRNVHVANLGYCRLGATFYTMLTEELIAQKKPKHIVVEVLDRPGMRSHPMFGYLASSKQVAAPPTILYGGFFDDVWKSTVVRWEQIRSFLYPTTEYQADLREHGFTRDPNIAGLSQMESIKKRRSRQTELPEISLQERAIFHLNWKNIEHIQQLCARNNVGLSFLYINQFGRPIKVPRFETSWSQYGEIWYPPDAIYQNAENYFDHGHLNKFGAEKLVPFLE
ncbi:MAG: hypothetical protein ACPGD8_09670, partial [Flavobacteriales bacterium]